MSQVAGSKRDIYRKLYSDTKTEIKNIVLAQKASIDAVLADYYHRQEVNATWGKWLSPLMIPFTVARGIFQSLNDTVLGIKAAYYNFMNNVSHVFDATDGYDWKTDLKYLAVDTVATLGEGLASTGVGIAADLITLFDVNINDITKSFIKDEFLDQEGSSDGENNLFKRVRDWAYGAKGEGGTVEDINNYFNSIRAGVLRGELFPERKPGQIGVPSNINQNIWILTGQKKTPDELNRKLVEGRWVTDESQLTSGENDNVFGSDEQRYKYFKKIQEAVAVNIERNRNVEKLTLKPQYDAAFGDSKLYKFEDDLFTNLGRMVPVLALAYLSGGLSETAPAAATFASALSTTFFGSMVYGQSFEQALEQGASINDAYTFAMGNMLLELGTEQIGGFKLGETPFLSAKGLISTGAQEGFEELVAELGQTALSYYGNKDNAIPMAEETPASLRARTAYSTIMGSISGMLMEGAHNTLINSNPTTRTQQSNTDLISLLKEGEKRYGLEKTAEEASKNVSKTLQYLNSSKVSDAQRLDITNGTIYRGLFDREKVTFDMGDGTTKNEYQYKLTPEGQKIVNQDISAYQGSQKISTQTHAVGTVTIMDRYDTQADNGQQIRIVTNDEIAQRNDANLTEFVKFAKKNHLPIAFVEFIGTPNKIGEVNAYINPNTGFIYLDYKKDVVQNYIAHEFNDKIDIMIKNGVLSKQLVNAYIKFIDLFQNEKFLNSLPKGYIDSIQRAYERAGNQDATREIMSNIIQDTFDNGTLLKRAFVNDGNLFRQVASIFTQQKNYNGLIEAYQFQDFKTFQQYLSKLQKAFLKVLKYSKGQILHTSGTLDSILYNFTKYTFNPTPEQLASFSLKVPDFYNENQKESIIQNVFGTQNPDKKMIFYRYYNNSETFLHNVFESQNGDVFASFFVDNVDDLRIKNLPLRDGSILVIPKSDFFQKKGERTFAFLPSETRTPLRTTSQWDGNTIVMKSSWNWEGMSYLQMKQGTFDYEKYCRGVKSEVYKAKLYGMGVVYQGLLNGDFYDYVNNNYKGNLSDYYVSSDTLVNLINLFRNSESFTEAEIKNYKNNPIISGDVYDFLIKEIFNEYGNLFTVEDLRVVFAADSYLKNNVLNEYIKKMLDIFQQYEYIIPKTTQIGEWFGMKELAMEFRGQELFWDFIAKVATNESLEGNLFLKHLYDGKYFKATTHTAKEMIAMAKNFAKAIYLRGGGTYFEVKSNLQPKDIGKVILYNIIMGSKSTSNLIKALEFYKIEYEIIFDNLNNAGEAIMKRGLNYADVQKNSHSLAVQMSLNLEEIEQKATQVKQTQVGVPLPATNAPFEKKTSKVSQKSQISQKNQNPPTTPPPTSPANPVTPPQGNAPHIFQRAQMAYNNTTYKDYKRLEREFADLIPGIMSRLEKSKKPFATSIKEWYKNWQDFVRSETYGNKLDNHIVFATSKALIRGFFELYDKISQDKNRFDKNPNQAELEEIADKVLEAMFAAHHYNDDVLRVEVNVGENNPQGFLHRKAIDWYLREMLAVKTWDMDTFQEFDTNGRGEAFRDIMHAILNFNQKGGLRKLNVAFNSFVNATDIQPAVNNSLGKDGGDVARTIDTVKEQWVTNTTNINNIKRISEYQTPVREYADGFTTSEILGLFDKRSWAMVTMNNIVEGVKRQLGIQRIYKQFFDKGKWKKQHYQDIVALDKEKNAIEVKNLGNIKVRPSQIMTLRNNIVREIVRNRAIALGLLRGNQTNHFDTDNKIRILYLTESVVAKRDKRTDAKIVDSMDLLRELDSIIENTPFMKEYNDMVLELLTTLYPYVNQRYMEIRGTELGNDGFDIIEQMHDQGWTQDQVDKFFNVFPDSINEKSVVNLYFPFLLDNSSYFNTDKLNAKEILDYGVFDGMTNELGNANEPVNIESITTVMNSYVQEVANYYGLHRVMRDLNLVLNEQIAKTGQIEYLNGLVSAASVKFFRELLIDAAGYKIGKRNTTYQKFLRFIRRNFYLTALAANVKVIFTQYATVLNLTSIYGDSFFKFGAKFMKNYYAQLTPKNKQILKKMKAQSNVYFDRSFNSIFEIGQAIHEGSFAGTSRFIRGVETLMGGIIATDNSINQAFYLTLLETINPETGQNYTEQEAMDKLDLAIMRSQSSALDLTKAPLLRTDSDLLKVFLKFLGEPMKQITQLYSSQKQLEMIKKFKKHQQDIAEDYRKTTQAEEVKLLAAEKKYRMADAAEQTADFATLPDDQQKAIVKARKEAYQEMKIQQRVTAKAQLNETVVNDFVAETISKQEEARNLAGRRATAFITSLLYLTVLGVGFQMLWTGGGKTDKSPDDTFLQYFLKKTAVQFGDELTGMFPFVRDVYQLIMKGFDASTIDSLTAMNDVLMSLGYVIKGIAGQNLNWNTTLHKLFLAAGQTFGIPVRNLEKLFNAALMYSFPTAYYKYQNFLGGRNRDNIALAQAIKDGDEQMITAIIEHKINARNIQVSDPVTAELTNLAKLGYEVSISGINDSFVQDGVTYVLNNNQKRNFANIYNQADIVITKLIRTSKYKRLNADMRQSLLQAVYNYYYRLAKQKTLESMNLEEEFDLVPKEKQFRSYTVAYQYFLERADYFYNKQISPEYKAEQREKKATT